MASQKPPRERLHALDAEIGVGAPEPHALRGEPTAAHHVENSLSVLVEAATSAIQAELDAAERQAESVLHDTRLQAEAIRQHGESEAREILAAAERQAQEVLQRARADAENAELMARVRAREIRAQAEARLWARLEGIRPAMQQEYPFSRLSRGAAPTPAPQAQPPIPQAHAPAAAQAPAPTPEPAPAPTPAPTYRREVPSYAPGERASYAQPVRDTQPLRRAETDRPGLRDHASSGFGLASALSAAAVETRPAAAAAPAPVAAPAPAPAPEPVPAPAPTSFAPPVFGASHEPWARTAEPALLPETNGSGYAPSDPGHAEAPTEAADDAGETGVGSAPLATDRLAALQAALEALKAPYNGRPATTTA